MLPNGEHRITVNDVEHWIRVEGSEAPGEPVVFIHGGPGANAFLLERTVGPHLGASHPVVYYDQRGCGRSGPAPGYSMEALVADLDGLIGALDLDAVTVAGFSFGGQVAAEYAVRHPASVRRLILVAPPILGPLRWDNRLAGLDAVADPSFRRVLRESAPSLEFAVGRPSFGSLRHLWAAMDAETGARFSLNDPEVRRPPGLPEGEGLAYNAEFADAVLAEQRPGSLLDDLAELDVPTLVIVGLYDRTVGVDACRDIVDRMANARLVLLSRSGHAPIEEPEAYADAMTAFLVS
ncbi:proline iminopeptidase [Hamadaea flava]|uniref:Alpha/beta fold hydrolase n=1 Tax=Hamadaea flava TaxID=1742688 RepID=A0ABV8LTQ7_9ACTN|nr:alpha/beta hydrolase [Hamadaea flava]MCP2321754.1 proline iminopeptidase [Hamadaea flava]